MPTVQDWARTVARRIADAWAGAADFPHDAAPLHDVLATFPTAQRKQCRRLLGADFIEVAHSYPTR